MKRYAIGFVLDDSLDRPDGVQQYVLTVGAWLQAQGHAVHYLVSTSTRRDVPRIHSLGKNMLVRFNGNRMRMPLPAPRQPIATLLENTKFDVLHVQMPYSPLLAGRVIKAASAETAIVGTFHIVPDSRLVATASKALAWWCRPTLRRFDEVVSVSEAAQDFARSAFGITSTVVPNAIDVARFRAAEPFSAKLPKQCQILFLGRLVPRKGCQLLLEAIRLLKQDATVPTFAVTICGKGPLAEQLQRYVDEHGLSDIVRFTGFVSEMDKPRYYASADITVFPSSGGESFGIVLVEAMSRGNAAVLAGDNSGYRCVLDSSPQDVLFDPRSAPGLAERLHSLITHTIERQQIASWQRTHAEQFDIHHVGRQLEDVYASALRQRPRLG